MVVYYRKFLIENNWHYLVWYSAHDYKYLGEMMGKFRAILMSHFLGVSLYVCVPMSLAAAEGGGEEEAQPLFLSAELREQLRAETERVERAMVGLPQHSPQRESISILNLCQEEEDIRKASDEMSHFLNRFAIRLLGGHRCQGIVDLVEDLQLTFDGMSLVALTIHEDAIWKQLTDKAKLNLARNERRICQSQPPRRTTRGDGLDYYLLFSSK